jgi:Chaperone of endosialidase
MSQSSSNNTGMGGGGSGITAINSIGPSVGGNFTLTAGANITLTDNPTGITISSTGGGAGVSSVTGTANQTIATPTTGNVVTSLTNGISLGSYQATTPPTGGILAPGGVNLGITPFDTRAFVTFNPPPTFAYTWLTTATKTVPDTVAGNIINIFDNTMVSPSANMNFIASFDSNTRFYIPTGVTVNGGACFYSGPFVTGGGINSGTLTNIYGFYASPLNGTPSGTITNAYGGYFNNPGFGTNQAALYATNLAIGTSGATPPVNGALILGNIQNTALTASSIVGTDASKNLISIANGTVGQVLTANAVGSPTFQTLAGSGVSSITATAPITASASTGAVTIGITTPLSPTFGGTGLNTSTAANGTLLIGNGTGFTLANLTAGLGIAIGNAAGVVMISATGGSGVTSIAGNTGPTLTGALTISTPANNGTLNFSGFGTTLSLNTSDTAGNIVIGIGAGPTVIGGSSNLFLLQSAGSLLTTGQGDIGIGLRALQNLLTGSNCIGIGLNTGTNYTSSESYNICIGTNTVGVTGENNVLRLGGATGSSGSGPGVISATYIQGISNNNSSGFNTPVAVYVDSFNGQLGFGPSGGSGVTSVTGTSNQILVTPSTGAAVVSIASTYAGQASITTLGTIGIGVWNGTTITVPNGGTGDVSFTAFTPVCGGTSSTAALQSVSNTGATAGQVLTYVSGSALPTWQTVSASGGVTSLSGDTGGPLSGALTIYTGYPNTNGTAEFVASGALIRLNSSDAFQNTGWGTGCLGARTLSGTPRNSAYGYACGVALTSATTNCLYGASCAASLTTGSGNALYGVNIFGLGANGAGNAVFGNFSASAYTGTEGNNVILGCSVAGVAGESNVLRIGNTTGTGAGGIAASYIQGISGVTVTGTAVICSTAGQLGTVVSSRRFKQYIEDMGDASEIIYKLRPVKFTYKANPEMGQQTGLIAEEVNDVAPRLTIKDKEGIPLAVQYHELPALLLNEIQKLRKRIEELEGIGA